MNDISGFFYSDKQIAFLGLGEAGGKANGLKFIEDFLKEDFNKDEFPEFEVTIPKMIVLKTDIFDEFMESNDLYEIALSDIPDNRKALIFQNADLPFHILGELRKIVVETKKPLAIRSSSQLEDAKFEPFAGIYGTKMTPNNQIESDIRFRKLVEAIKFVYASTFFDEARNYLAATKHNAEDEKMAVIIQEVVGEDFGEQFYPHISGVARSYNYYPSGGATPEEGVVNLAMGLGKTIVDGGTSWAYSPASPMKGPPFKSMGHMLRDTQLNFWGVRMKGEIEYDPINEKEYLMESHFADVEGNKPLSKIFSTYNPESDRIWPGKSKGQHIITFAPILQDYDTKFNDLIKRLLKLSEKATGSPVEIEFAVSLSEDTSKKPHRFGFLQVRPMVVSYESIELKEDELFGENVVLASDTVLGNGVIDNINDVVFVKKEAFDTKNTRKIAKEIDSVYKKLLKDGRKCLLIGYGRWGTTDDWAGIPVDWSNISAAKVIAEVGLINVIQEMSQGSHFFHNVTSFKVHYFSIPYNSDYGIDWGWLNENELVEETNFIRHMRLEKPLMVKTDGRTGKGVVLKG